MKFTAKQIADLLQGTIEGDPQASVQTFAKIEEGVEGAISFLANPHYEHYIYDTKSSVVLVNQDFAPSQPVSATLIRVPNAYEAIARLLAFYESQIAKRSGIHPTACIDPSATVGENCYIGPFVYIGEGATVGNGSQIYAHTVIEKNAKVGSDCLFYPNVSVYHDCEIGNRVTLHSGCVIGADGSVLPLLPTATKRFLRLARSSSKTMWKSVPTVVLTVQQWAPPAFIAA